MADNNGQQDNLSRLDRIEKALEDFVEEHRRLFRSRILLQGALEDLSRTVKEQKDNLNFVIGGIDRDHRGFHERLKRLEPQH